ncbi:MAG TPA: glycosyltransferase [Devosia sp.]|nr:glycosyltransferase [Devosia sp.]
MRSIDPETARPAAPLVSVVMANYQAGDKLVSAIESVLRQSVGDLELIICDDGSTDHSIALVEQFSRADPRVRLIRAEANGGPARSRNRGLDAARGQWIAIVDSDDIIHPERFERLLAAASYRQADIVADDLLHFYEDGTPATLLLPEGQDRLFTITPGQWIEAGLNGSPPLGYLKPLIRAEALGALRYDESLHIGEDYDLVLRLLLAGAVMIVVPEPYYLYRRHSGSISHRLAAADLMAMIDSQDAMSGRLGDLPQLVAEAFSARRTQLAHGLAFVRLVEAIKGRRIGQAMLLLAGNPRLAIRLWQSFLEGRNQKTGMPVNQLVPSGTVTLDEVPDYVAVAAVDWGAPRPRQIWVKLANLGRSQPIDIACADAATRYAAGFIPLARVHEPAELVP